MDKQRSLTATPKALTVPHSPLNPVKRELGLMLMVAVLLWLGVGPLTDSTAAQLGLLSLYGVLAGARLVYRARRTLQQFEQQSNNDV